MMEFFAVTRAIAQIAALAATPTLARTGDHSLVAATIGHARGPEDVTESYPGCRSGPRKSSQSRATRPVPIPTVLNVTQRCAHVYPRLPSNHRGMLASRYDHLAGRRTSIADVRGPPVAMKSPSGALGLSTRADRPAVGRRSLRGCGEWVEVGMTSTTASDPPAAAWVL